MIKSKPAALPSYYASTHSLIAVVAYTVEVTLPEAPPEVSSAESADYQWRRTIKNLLFRTQANFSF